ncbi:tripartite tricarboxylate transporter TctB family protein [Telmatospirillum sp. J64-1]|uniref:tripartite tricarboxylate transporter TctB family protein n=1 Tax=Telmatospirillum sp. J64-1 TaxID=2502183 RepID=UPI00115CB183|nr:tripartite tricarboxylate transporter TctB family protein [Telmatospirillum sp. J64-1]
MMNRDYRDMVAGGLLMALGAGAALYASASYNLGTITRMGAGMMPTALGWILAAFGAAIMIGAYFRPGPRPEVRVVTPIFILGGVAAFALVIKPFGLLPAVVACVVVSSMAERAFKPVRWILLSSALCVLAYLIFSVSLRLPIPVVAWPF